MQFPHENAAPFEFARPILLLAAVAFSVGFGGYLAVNPHAAAPAAHDSVAQTLTPSTAATLETPVVETPVRSSRT
jgi:hypothetical protein